MEGEPQDMTQFDTELGKFNIINKYNSLMELDGISNNDSDFLKYYNDFVNAGRLTEVSIDDNANVSDMSIISFYNEAPKALFKRAAMEHIKEHAGVEAYKAVLEGYLYPHDTTKWFSCYCWAFDLDKLVEDGIDFIPDLKIDAPKHATSFIDLVIQATAFISNNIAGAVSYPNLLVHLDKFLSKDFGSDYTKYREQGCKEKNDIEQMFQKLVYSFNYPFRSQQSSFTNLSIFDKYFAKDLFGNRLDYERFNKLQEWFCDYFIQMNETIQPFTFPVLTATMYEKDGEIQDKDFLTQISKQNIRRGTFNIYAGELGVLSSCCRLRNDSNIFTSALGTPSISIGSSRVVTLNMALIAEESKGNINTFNSRLRHYYNLACDILVSHRQMLEEAIKKGKHPLYSKNWMFLNRQFCTIGFVGLHEAIECLGKNIATEEGQDMAVSILQHMNEWNKHMSKFTGYMFNIEQVPAESAAISLAKKTNLKIKEDKYTILSNQYIPLTYDENLIDRVVTQGKLDNLTQGGGILHINMDSKIEDYKDMEGFIRYVVRERVKYFAINYMISVCSKCNTTYITNAEVSPCCNAKLDKHIRVVGFLRPIRSFSNARKNEALNRKFYSNEETIGGKL